MSKMILRPYDPAEAIGTAEAAQRAGKSERCIRNWCMEHHLGRKISGHLAVSQVALDMHLAGDTGAMGDYLDGDRTADRVCVYYARRSLSVPST